MKKSKAETTETRKRIVELAAQAFKSNGIEATGVAEIMASAGLTHGGFYRHFSSKEQLVAEACAISLEKLVEGYAGALERGSGAFLKYLQSFMTPVYRDDHAGGCPLVAMGSELVRADESTRRTASAGFGRLLGSIEKAIPGSERDEEAAKDVAISLLCNIIGAVTMSRVVDDRALSDRILAATKRRMAEVLGRSAPKRRSATTKRKFAANA